ncbi:MAG: aspartate kinase [Pyrinomonadaceae bacterium]|nr:aspartate kinase [Pyrinomonadaceae bacterium]
MSVPVTVMKFGGTSLEDGPGFARVAELLRSQEIDDGPPPIAVVSAMSGVTDALMRSLRLAQEDGSASAARSLEPHFDRHMEVARALGATAASTMRQLLETARKEIVELLEADRRDDTSSRSRNAITRDAISSYGEILSAHLLRLVLNEYGSPASYVDARRCIKTNGDYGNARPLGLETALHTRAELQSLLNRKRLPVLGGFIGATIDGVTTTMGRGSSNHTATLVSAALGARETQIWTDVNGVHTADPSLVEQARTISHLSYDEAEEIARLGAKVLHQRMFEPVRAQQIPIRIRNSQSPRAEGTLISAQSPSPEASPTQTIKAIAHRNHLIRIDVRSTPALVANGFQRSIEAIFNRHQISMEIVGGTAEGLSLACDEGVPLAALVQELNQCGSVEVTRSRAVVGCVGEGLNSPSDAVNRMTEILKSFDSTLEWQKISRINLVSLVDAGLVGQLVKRLHHEIFEQ